MVGKVRLEISPSFVGVLDVKGSDWVILEKEIGERATIGKLLADIACGDINFRKVVFDPDTGKMSDQVMVVLNDSLLKISDVPDVKLKHGDIVVLLLTYGGG